MTACKEGGALRVPRGGGGAPRAPRDGSSPGDDTGGPRTSLGGAAPDVVVG